MVPTSVMLNWEMECKKWCPAFKLLTYFGSATAGASPTLSTSASPHIPSCFRSVVMCIAHALVEGCMLWARFKCLYEQCMCLFNAHASAKTVCFGRTAHACITNAWFECSAPTCTKVICCGDTNMNIYQLGLLASDVMCFRLVTRSL